MVLEITWEKPTLRPQTIKAEQRQNILKNKNPNKHNELRKKKQGTQKQQRERGFKSRRTNLKDEHENRESKAKQMVGAKYIERERDKKRKEKKGYPILLLLFRMTNQSEEED